MEKFEKVNHRLLGEHVEAQLKEYILATPVNVGDKIPTEFELASLNWPTCSASAAAPSARRSGDS